MRARNRRASVARQDEPTHSSAAQVASTTDANAMASARITPLAGGVCKHSAQGMKHNPTEKGGRIGGHR
eukprot:1697763-Alexandrium_andersonii.AAC.1